MNCIVGSHPARCTSVAEDWNTIQRFMQAHLNLFRTTLQRNIHCVPILGMKKKQAKQNKRPKRDDSATFLCSPQEKECYEQAGVVTDQSMSDWIRKTLKVALTELGIQIKDQP